MSKVKWTEGCKERLLNLNTDEELNAFAKELGVKLSTVERQKRKLKKLGVHKNLYYENQIRELQKKNTSLREMVDLQAVLVDVAKRHIEALPPVKKPIPRKKDSRVIQEIACLMLSDLHIGDVIKEDEMGGINAYDFDIFSKRLEIMADGIISIKEKLTGYNLPHLEIFGLGDFVTGIIHEELVANAEDTIIEWLFNGALVMSQFIADLLTVFNTVHFTGVVGNHGRLSVKKTFKRRYVNWDYIFYQTLAIMMKNNSRVTFDIPKSFWVIRNVGGREILLLHGDNIRSWSGIPWYGIQRAVFRLTELLASNQRYFDDACLAHFHNEGSLSRTKGKIMLNGSVIGGDEYSTGALFVSTDPEQKFFGINPAKKRKTWNFNLELKDISKTTGRYKYSNAISIVDQLKKINND